MQVPSKLLAEVTSGYWWKNRSVFILQIYHILILEENNASTSTQTIVYLFIYLSVFKKVKLSVHCVPLWPVGGLQLPQLPELLLPTGLPPSFPLCLTLTFWQLLPCLHFAFPQGAMLLPGSALAPRHWRTWTVQTPQTRLLLDVLLVCV